VPEKRGAPERFEVRLLVQDEVPVGRVAQRRERVAPERRDFLGVEDYREGENGKQCKEERREQASCAAHPERFQVDRPG
jgi:hypothetical protein